MKTKLNEFHLEQKANLVNFENTPQLFALFVYIYIFTYNGIRIIQIAS